MEIRNVPKGWEHPKDEYREYKPMLDLPYIDVLNEWWKNHELWLKGEHPDQKEQPEETKDIKYFAQHECDPQVLKIIISINGGMRRKPVFRCMKLFPRELL